MAWFCWVKAGPRASPWGMSFNVALSSPFHVLLTSSNQRKLKGGNLSTGSFGRWERASICLAVDWLLGGSSLPLGKNRMGRTKCMGVPVFLWILFLLSFAPLIHSRDCCQHGGLYCFTAKTSGLVMLSGRESPSSPILIFPASYLPCILHLSDWVYVLPVYSYACRQQIFARLLLSL